MKNLKSGIYCWTSPSNKKYIGQAVYLKKRKTAFLAPSTKNYGGDLINKARKKYNPQLWKYEVLCYCPIDELDSREQELIALYDTTNREKGYNLAIGGGGCKGMKQSKETIENRAKHQFKKVLQIDLYEDRIIKEWDCIRDAAKSVGLKCTSTIIKCCKGLQSHSMGFRWCYVGELEKLKSYVEYVRPSKPIYQVDKYKNEIIKEWKGAIHIHKELGVELSTIYECCKGIVTSIGGFRWCYKETGMTKEWIEATTIKKEIPVEQLDPKTGEVIARYKSIREANRAMGGNEKNTNISYCCRGKKYFNTAHGFKWRYAS